MGLACDQPTGRTATLVLTGELDLMAVPALSGQLTSVLRTHPGQLVLDLAGVTFIDCAVARLIAQAGQCLAAAGQGSGRTGGKPVLTGCAPAVCRLFDLTGLAGYVDLRTERAGRC